MTKSNFWKYFRYKLSKRWVSIIIFALINFMSVLFTVIIFGNSMKELAEIVESEQTFLIYGSPLDFIYQILVFAIIISVIMIVATTVGSLKIYHSRAQTDMLGCLPISYKERFWGDFLSGIFSNFVSLVPMYLISLIFTEAMKDPIDRVRNSKFGLDYTDLPTAFSYIGLTIMLVYLGTYAVTTFISSCCGKKGSSILYSFVIMAAIPGIYLVYGNYMFSYVLGMDAYSEVARNICILPPFGPIVSFKMFGFDYWEVLSNPDLMTLVNNPFNFVIYLLITAAFIAGAYFIGKRRRAEKIGEGFVFKSAYHVLTITFMIMLIGAAEDGYSKLMENSGTLWVMLLSFVVYAALEISQNKGFKGFWKTAVRFAALFGVCFAFQTLVRTTNAFGIYNDLPGKGSIKEIRVSGNYFYSPTIYEHNRREYTLTETESFSEILGEHKMLLESEDLRTGSELKITYKMKSGREITRQYSINNADPDNMIKNFSDAVKQLPDYNIGNLGVIDEPDLDKYIVTVQSTGKPEKFIRRDKLGKLAELLRYDIENNYLNIGTDQEIYGKLRFVNKIKEDYLNVNSSNYYSILPSYKDTIEFLNDPENYTEEREESDANAYSFNYTSDHMRLHISVSEEDTSAAAKELLSYIKPTSYSNNYGSSNGLRVRSDTTFVDYTIDPANEEAALKAMLTLFREKNVHKD